MAGKTQFTEKWTVNLTPEQAEAAYQLITIKGQSKQDFLMNMLKLECEIHGIPWPIVEKKPIGNRAPRKAKFMKS